MPSTNDLYNNEKKDSEKMDTGNIWTVLLLLFY